MKPVRVTFMIDNLSRAGTESQLLALIRTLDRTRVQPTLVLLDGEPETSRSLEPENCPILRLNLKKLVGGDSITAAQKLKQFWQIHRPQIGQFYFMDSAYFGIPIAKFVGIRQIIRVRNNLSYWLTTKHRFLNRLLKPMVNFVLTNSQEGKTAVMEHDQLPAERVLVIENGVDLDRFPSPALIDRTTITIGCVANLRPVKNIDGLMRVAKLLTQNHPNIRFIVAGDGEQRAELEQQRLQMNLEHHWEFAGSVSDVPGFLQQLDIAVLPSHSEGMSNALLEYMAAGRAIVATDVGANAQLLGHGVCGLLTPVGDDLALANAIDNLIPSYELRRTLGNAARQRVMVNYSRDSMRLKFENMYATLVSGAVKMVCQ